MKNQFLKFPPECNALMHFKNQENLRTPLCQQHNILSRIYGFVLLICDLLTSKREIIVLYLFRKIFKRPVSILSLPQLFCGFLYFFLRALTDFTDLLRTAKIIQRRDSAPKGEEIMDSLPNAALSSIYACN